MVGRHGNGDGGDGGTGGGVGVRRIASRRASLLFAESGPQEGTTTSAAPSAKRWRAHKLWLGVAALLWGAYQLGEKNAMFQDIGRTIVTEAATTARSGDANHRDGNRQKEHHGSDNDDKDIDHDNADDDDDTKQQQQEEQDKDKGNDHDDDPPTGKEEEEQQQEDHDADAKNDNDHNDDHNDDDDEEKVEESSNKKDNAAMETEDDKVITREEQGQEKDQEKDQGEQNTNERPDGGEEEEVEGANDTAGGEEGGEEEEEEEKENSSAKEETHLDVQNDDNDNDDNDEEANHDTQKVKQSGSDDENDKKEKGDENGENDGESDHDDDDDNNNNDENDDNNDEEKNKDSYVAPVGVLHVGLLEPDKWPQYSLSSNLGRTICEGLRQIHIMPPLPTDEDLLSKELLPPPPSDTNGGELQEVVFHPGSCQEQQVGNQLQEIYAARVIASAAGAAVKFTLACPPTLDDDDHKDDDPPPSSLFLWLAQYLAQRQHPVDDWGFNRTHLEFLCRQCDVPYLPPRPQGTTGFGFRSHLAEYAAETVRDEVRLFAKEWRPEQSLDSVAIHYRCGDALNFPLGGNDYGLVPFFVILQLLQEAIDEEDDDDDDDEEGPTDSDKSLRISILTQSFVEDEGRPHDREFVATCQVVVQALASFLEKHVRQREAQVSIHAGVSVPETFARIIGARNVAICGPSTFCQFPLLASMARRGYVFQMTTGSMGHWMQVDRNHASLAIL